MFSIIAYSCSNQSDIYRDVEERKRDTATIALAAVTDMVVAVAMLTMAALIITGKMQSNPTTAYCLLPFGGLFMMPILTFMVSRLVHYIKEKDTEAF